MSFLQKLITPRTKTAIRVVLLALVTWGIFVTARRAASDLENLRTDLTAQAEQAELAAEQASDASERKRLIESAQSFRREARDFWKADSSGLLWASILYACGMLPAALFWRRCLGALGQETQLLESMSAYFVGNLGKYFPGKAMVLVLRVRGLGRSHVKKTATTITIFMETLTLMSVGGAVAALCLIGLRLQWWLTALAIGLLLVTFIPTIPPVLKRLVPRLQKGVAEQEIKRWTDRITWRLLLVGWTALAITWTLFSLSLLTVLQSLPTTAAADAPWMSLVLSAGAACSLAVVLGFVSLIPGGAGVRELVLSIVLTPVVGPTSALSAAVWMRAVWLVTELVTAAFTWLLDRIVSSRHGRQHRGTG